MIQYQVNTGLLSLISLYNTDIFVVFSVVSRGLLHINITLNRIKWSCPPGTVSLSNIFLVQVAQESLRQGHAPLCISAFFLRSLMCLNKDVLSYILLQIKQLVIVFIDWSRYDGHRPHVRHLLLSWYIAPPPHCHTFTPFLCSFAIWRRWGVLK